MHCQTAGQANVLSQGVPASSLQGISPEEPEKPAFQESASKTKRRDFFGHACVHPSNFNFHSDQFSNGGSLHEMLRPPGGIIDGGLLGVETQILVESGKNFLEMDGSLLGIFA